jgi:maltooligosyltrehalose trehalohydrolase
VYAGQYSPHRRRRHGAPATDVPADRFVVCLQNHDQVGNRASGERLSTLLGPAQLRLASALLLLSPYVPLLFMGEEYGETNPFLYFVSHSDDALVAAVRHGRREEFASFAWREDVPDPQAEETFCRSRLDRARRDTPDGAAALALHRDLLRLRREEPALRPGSAGVRVACDEASGWITLALAPTAGGRELLALFNASPVAREVPVGDAGDVWTCLWSSGAAAYNGSGGAPRVGADVRQRAEMAPWAAAQLARGATP